MFGSNEGGAGNFRALCHMSCEQWEETLMDLARRRPMDADLADAATGHAAACPACADLLQRERALTEDLRSLGRIVRTVEAPPHVEQAVMAGFHAHTKRRREVVLARWLTVAATLALITSAALILLRPAPKHVAAAPQQRQVEDFRGFMAVPYRTQPIERGYVVRVQIPRSALISLGMPVSAGQPEVVQADLLLAEDGLAQAVRLVR